MEALVDLLPDHSALKDSSNELRKVLDKTVGAFCDDCDVLDFYDQLFLNSARGGFLDLFGRDYGVSRRLDEDDESYRERIIFEKLEYLTAHNLQEIYGVELFSVVSGFNPSDNTLTSDNTYLTDFYMGVADEDTRNILDKKFILDGSVVWFNGTPLDYIINTSNIDVLKDYLEIYTHGSNLYRYFKDNTSIKKVGLTLPKVSYTDRMFEGCTGLTYANLVLDKCTKGNGMFYECTNLVNADVSFYNDTGNPSYTYIVAMFYGCSALKNVKINAPCLSSFDNMFQGCTALETIEFNINTAVTPLKSYVLGLNLPNLTTFIINGEEVDLS